MNRTLEIQVEEHGDGCANVYVTLNGVIIGSGGIGGEPEDNTIYRDYDWIIPLIKNLALSLDVEVLEKTITED